MARTVAQSAAQAAGDVGEKVQKHAGDWVERLARLGYAAKGVLYLLVGGLAVQAAIGWGQVSDSRSALTTLEGKWWIGTALLWVIAVGLAGYALWNFFRAIFDPEHEGRDASGIAKRLFFVISGAVHASLAFWCVTYLLKTRGWAGGGQTRDTVGRVLEWGMAGRLVIAVAGGLVIGYGVHQLIRAWKVDLSDQLSLSQMSAGMRKLAIFTGRFGMAARGVILVLIGWFFLQAAWYAAQGEAGGLGDALRTVGSFGTVLLALVAIGLAAYGVHMLITARYRRIEAN
jgi:hypothetical protein